MQVVQEEVKLKELISAEKIKERIQEVAKDLDLRYEGRELKILMIMKGALCLAADLMRNLHLKLSLDYVRCKSYKGVDRGELSIIGLEGLDIEGSHILVIDDIFDSGVTMASVIERLQKEGPASLESLVLLNKKVKKQTSYAPTYSLFHLEDEFVIGYGLDYEENYRELPGIYAFEEPPV